MFLFLFVTNTFKYAFGIRLFSRARILQFRKEFREVIQPQKFPNIKSTGNNMIAVAADEETIVSQDILLQQPEEAMKTPTKIDDGENKSPASISPYQLPTSPQVAQNEDEESDDEEYIKQTENYKDILSYFSPRWKSEKDKQNSTARAEKE